MEKKYRKTLENLLEQVVFSDDRLGAMKKLIQSFSSNEISPAEFRRDFIGDQVDLTKVILDQMLYFIKEFIVPKINNYDDSEIRKVFEAEIDEKDEFLASMGKRLEKILEMAVISEAD